MLDLFHCNSLEWMHQPHLWDKGSIYTPSNVLVSARNQDLLAILDLEAGKAVWTWGAGQVEGQHEASAMPNGHILLFDNGSWSRNHSRIVELDPLTGKVVWEYSAPEPRDFYSKTRGAVQYLPNDGFLVGNSNRGEAFEIDRKGRIVWRFLNPHVDDKGRRGTLRIKRYPLETIDGILEGRRPR